jgi:hypothetical protein
MVLGLANLFIAGRNSSLLRRLMTAGAILGSVLTAMPILSSTLTLPAAFVAAGFGLAIAVGASASESRCAGIAMIVLGVGAAVASTGPQLIPTTTAGPRVLAFSIATAGGVVVAVHTRLLIRSGARLVIGLTIACLLAVPFLVPLGGELSFRGVSSLPIYVCMGLAAGLAPALALASSGLRGEAGAASRSDLFLSAILSVLLVGAMIALWRELWGARPGLGPGPLALGAAGLLLAGRLSSLRTNHKATITGFVLVSIVAYLRWSF